MFFNKRSYFTTYALLINKNWLLEVPFALLSLFTKYTDPEVWVFKLKSRQNQTVLSGLLTKTDITVTRKKFKKLLH